MFAHDRHDYLRLFVATNTYSNRTLVLIVITTPSFGYRFGTTTSCFFLDITCLFLLCVFCFF